MAKFSHTQKHIRSSLNNLPQPLSLSRPLKIETKPGSKFRKIVSLYFLFCFNCGLSGCRRHSYNRRGSKKKNLKHHAFRFEFRLECGNNLHHRTLSTFDPGPDGERRPGNDLLGMRLLWFGGQANDVQAHGSADFEMIKVVSAVHAINPSIGFFFVGVDSCYQRNLVILDSTNV